MFFCFGPQMIGNQARMGRDWLTLYSYTSATVQSFRCPTPLREELWAIVRRNFQKISRPWLELPLAGLIVFSSPWSTPLGGSNPFILSFFHSSIR